MLCGINYWVSQVTAGDGWFSAILFTVLNLLKKGISSSLMTLSRF